MWQTLINTFAALSFRESGQHVTISRLLGIILYNLIYLCGTTGTGSKTRSAIKTILFYCNGAMVLLFS